MKIVQKLPRQSLPSLCLFSSFPSLPPDIQKNSLWCPWVQIRIFHKLLLKQAKPLAKRQKETSTYKGEPGKIKGILCQIKTVSSKILAAGELHRAEAETEAPEGEGEGEDWGCRREGGGPVPVHRLAGPRHAHQHPPVAQLHQEIIGRNSGQSRETKYFQLHQATH